MNKPGFFFALLINFLSANYISAQPQFRSWSVDPNTNLNMFGTNTDFESEYIADDFGPRQLNSTNNGYREYDWHGGIDYNGPTSNGDDYGDLVLALEEATVSRWSQMLSGTKSVMLEGTGANGHILRYIHVFTGGQLVNFPNGMTTGGCILKAMDSPNDNLSINGERKWAIIIMDNGHYRAFGPVPPSAPGYVTFLDETGAIQTLEVQHTVPLNVGFTPLGNSQGFPPHLHLEILTQTNDNGSQISAGDDRFAKNPLQLYAHDVPEYNLRFLLENDNTVGINVTYPGTNNSTVQVHAELDGQQNNQPANRYHVVMNADNVQILLKRDQENDYHLIKGPFYESEFSLGARIGQNRLLLNTVQSDAVTGSWTSTNMQPFAYAGLAAPYTHHPRDDYYFADFVSRIHKNDPKDGNTTPTQIAGCNEDARYPDDSYEAKIRLVDVAGTPHEGPNNASGNLTPYTFVLDNFRPYIREVTVNISSILIYTQEWECMNNCIQFTHHNPNASVPASLIKTTGFDIHVQPSEPLRHCFISIDALNISNQEMSQESSFPAGLGFKFHIAGFTITEAIEEIVLSFSGEDLNGNSIIAFNSSNASSCYRVPTRDDDNTWDNPDHLSFGTDEIHRFCLGCGMSGGFTGHPENAKRSSPFSCETQVNIIPDDIELSADIMNPTFNMDCRNGSIDLHIEGGIGPYNVTWYFVYYNPPYEPFKRVIQSVQGITGNDDGEDVDKLPSLRGLNSYFCVEVTDALCGMANQCFYVECECSNDCSLEAQVVNSVCGQNGAIYASISCSEDGHMPFSAQWSDLQSNPQSMSRTGLSSGIYCLTVTDKDGCSFNQCWEVEETKIDIQVSLVEITNSALCREHNAICNGSLTITVPLGASVNWHNIPNQNQIHSLTVTNLCPGQYTVDVQLMGCTKSATFTIGCCTTWPAEGEPQITEEISVKGEADSEDRSITIEVSGGGGQIYFDWSGPNGYHSDDKNIHQLEPGTYCVRVFDGCSEDEKCFTIVDCNVTRLNINPVIENTCNEVGAGSINLNISGGTPPYSISWSSGQTSESIGHLFAGQYCVNIKDAAGCKIKNECFTIFSFPGEVSTSTTPCARTIRCNGEDFTDFFQYIPTPDCNDLHLFCPVTNETVTIHQNFLDVFTVDCNVFGTCFFTGENILLEFGNTITNNPPAFQSSSGCPQPEIACFNSFCLIDGQFFINGEDPPYCATEEVAFHCDDETNAAICGSNSCVIDVFCGSIYIGSYCDNNYNRCYCALQDSTPIISRSEGVNSQIKLFQRDIELTKNTENNLVNLKSVLTVYPNPTTGQLWLKGIGNGTLTISNASGIKLRIINYDFEQEKSPVELNISSFNQGVYFFRFVNNEGRISIVKVVLI